MNKYEEIACRVLLRAKSEKKRIQRKKKTTIFTLVCFVLLSVIAVFCFRYTDRYTVTKTEPEDVTTPVVSTKEKTNENEPNSQHTTSSVSDASITDDNGVVETTVETEYKRSIRIQGSNNASMENTDRASASSATVPATSDIPDKSGGYSFAEESLPESLKIDNSVILYEGEQITQEEAQAYLKENMPWIQSALEQSGVSVEDVQYSHTGIRHMSVKETCVVHLNYIDYLLYSNGKLVAILNLFKENGQIYATPSFGAPWFDDYAGFLSSHKGEKLLFLYVGMQEIILLPDNRCVNPMNQEINESVKKQLDYQKMYCDEIVFVPE